MITSSKIVRIHDSVYSRIRALWIASHEIGDWPTTDTKLVEYAVELAERLQELDGIAPVRRSL
jgi:hypothetical protein